MHERDRTETVPRQVRGGGRWCSLVGPQGAWDHDGWGADRFVFQSGIRRRAPTCRAFADFIWGVLDMVPSAETDFPDYRNKAAIHSDQWVVHDYPREGDTIRLYLQLTDHDVVDPATGRVNMQRCGPDMLLKVRRGPSIDAPHPF